MVCSIIKGLLRCAPMMLKQDPVVYGAGFGVMFLAEGPRTARNFNIHAHFISIVGVGKRAY